METTHASFFSGVGGMDIGLERAGWRTVSFSEVEPYACAVLGERWPGVPNLGDITAIEDGGQPSGDAGRDDELGEAPQGWSGAGSGRNDWRSATLWTGGFPCQDLSVAGKRSGFEGKRSVLAFSFLDLVQRHRPSVFLLENVVGLLSSNDGRDFGRLLREVGELRYRWAYRVLDAQWFGVPQRRKRVFILAFDSDRHPDPDGPASVLAVGTRCVRDHLAEREAWSKAPGRAGQGAEASGLGRAGVAERPGVDGSPPDSGRVREADGVAGRLDNREVAFTQNQREEVRLLSHYAPTLSGPGSHQSIYVKSRRASSNTDFETWVDGAVMPTLNQFDASEVRATGLVASTVDSTGFQKAYHQRDRVYVDVAPTLDAHAHSAGDAPMVTVPMNDHHEHEMLPLGIDSSRYRAIGNGVASPVAEWIGVRLLAYLRDER